MFLGRYSFCRRRVGEGQQFVDTIHRMPCDDLGQHVAQIGLRIDAVHFASLCRPPNVEKTRNDYIRHVRTFTAFLGRSPDTATREDLRRFQLHQTQTGVRPPSINGSVVALRFFFTVTFDRPEMGRHLTFVREPRRMPAILSLEEIGLLLEAAPGPKYKAALGTAYGAGLRVTEVVALKVPIGVRF